MAPTPDKDKQVYKYENSSIEEGIDLMDFKPTKYKKGELVQFFRRPDETLGIVKGHDGGKVEVEWVKWPSQVRPHHGWYPMYKVQRVEKAG